MSTPYPRPSQNTTKTGNMTCAFWARNIPCSRSLACKYAHYQQTGMPIADLPRRDPHTGLCIVGRNLREADEWHAQRRAELQRQQQQHQQQRLAEQQQQERQQRWSTYLVDEARREGLAARQRLEEEYDERQQRAVRAEAEAAGWHANCKL